MATKIEIYADGSATTADNEGGWGCVILLDGIFHKELSGHLQKATNNDAELIASINGLEYILDYICKLSGSFPLEMEVVLISDSQIILNWANGSYRFKQTEKLPLYNQLRSLMKKMDVKTQWVKGHSGNIWNERCDRLANAARKGLTRGLDKIDSMLDTKIGTKKDSVVSLWFDGQLKIIDFDTGIIENYNREIHGKRGSVIEIRKVKER